MRRVGHLWEQLVSWANLLASARKARRGKRNRPDVAAFHFDLEGNLLQLQRELVEGTYRPGPYREFRIFEPKPRLISAAPYCDRVVHHALCRVLEPVFERCFHQHSYACRPGKGTHRAISEFRRCAKKNAYVLKCDIRKYFPSIDHGVVKTQLARKVKDYRVLALAGAIIDGSNAQEPVYDSLPGDDLFAPRERRRGLPRGNQTSQFFSNVVLDVVDHGLSRPTRPGGYVRYCDDFVMFAPSTPPLVRTREQCRVLLGQLRLRLHPERTVIDKLCNGTRFLGSRVVCVSAPRS